MNDESGRAELTKEESSEFKVLLEALRKEVAFAMDLSNDCAGFADALSPMLQPEVVPNESKFPMGVIGHLWNEVELLRISNKRMMETNQHLSKVIGR